MTWIVTADGHECSLEFPVHADYNIGRIAHSLAQINRFNGHAARPYSVAEHSLLVLDIAERHLRLDVHGQMAALMHDAHEAFVGDVSTPMKDLLGAPMRRIELRHSHLMSLQFNFHTALTVHHFDVKSADTLALAVERFALLPSSTPAGEPCTPWPSLMAAPVLPGYDLMDEGRVNTTWQEWRDRFIDAFQTLQFARAELAHERAVAPRGVC